MDNIKHCWLFVILYVCNFCDQVFLSKASPSIKNNIVDPVMQSKCLALPLAAGGFIRYCRLRQGLNSLLPLAAGI